jgi:hypothetical protein
MPLNNLLKFDLSQPSLKANTAQAEFVTSALQALAWRKSSFKRLRFIPLQLYAVPTFPQVRQFCPVLAVCKSPPIL